MPFHKNINSSLQVLANTFNINFTKFISFDLSGYLNSQKSIDLRGSINNKKINQFNLNKNGLNLQITGWNCDSSVESRIQQAMVRSLNGLNIIEENQTDYNMLLLSFNQNVSLASLELGWIEGDNNVSILALTNGEINSFSDKQWPQLLSDGWHPAGEYFNLDYMGNGNRINLNKTVSKYWLIGAYNPNLYNYLSNNTYQKCQFDKFKLQSITVSTENILIKAKKFTEKICLEK